MIQIALLTTLLSFSIASYATEPKQCDKVYMSENSDSSFICMWGIDAINGYYEYLRIEKDSFNSQFAVYPRDFFGKQSVLYSRTGERRPLDSLLLKILPYEYLSSFYFVSPSSDGEKFYGTLFSSKKHQVVKHDLKTDKTTILELKFPGIHGSEILRAIKHDIGFKGINGIVRDIGHSSLLPFFIDRTQYIKFENYLVVNWNSNNIYYTHANIKLPLIISADKKYLISFQTKDLICGWGGPNSDCKIESESFVINLVDLENETVRQIFDSDGDSFFYFVSDSPVLNENSRELTFKVRVPGNLTEERVVKF